MNSFVKQHKCLTVLAILSIVVIVLSLTFQCDKSPVLLLVVQIAIGYLINVIFYITQSYLPTKRRAEVSHKIISSRIDKIVEDMRAFPNAMIKQLPSNSKSRKEQVKESTNGFYIGLILEHAGLCACGHNEYKKWTAGDYLYTKIRLVEDQIDFIRKYYSSEIYPELDEIFEKINNTSIHTALKMHLEGEDQITYGADGFVKYDELADELEKVRELYL